MLITINSTQQLNTATQYPICPLMCLWTGQLEDQIKLPQLGHLLIIYPLDEGDLMCDHTRIPSTHYLVIHPEAMDHQLTLNPLLNQLASVLVLMISPGFIGHLAEFLGIPTDFDQLLHGLPLPQGDNISSLCRLLAERHDNQSEADELLMEIVGQILRYFRHRYEALQSLNQHKKSTIEDLVPRLLEARQYIEANYLRKLKTADVADYVAVSEYHFARLFSTAFDSTVHQYVIQLRMNEARARLEHPNQSITDIAFDIGYNSMSAFINAFKKYSGQTPSQYRARFG